MQNSELFTDLHISHNVARRNFEIIISNLQSSAGFKSDEKYFFDFRDFVLDFVHYLEHHHIVEDHYLFPVIEEHAGNVTEFLQEHLELHDVIQAFKPTLQDWDCHNSHEMLRDVRNFFELLSKIFLPHIDHEEYRFDNSYFMANFQPDEIRHYSRGVQKYARSIEQSNTALAFYMFSLTDKEKEYILGRFPPLDRFYTLNIALTLNYSEYFNRIPFYFNYWK